MSFFVPYYSPAPSTAHERGGGGGGSCRNSGVGVGSDNHGVSPKAGGGQIDEIMVARGGSEGLAVDFQGCKTLVTSRDMGYQASLDGRNGPCNSIVSIAVAVDKDKNSPHAVRWAVDNLATSHPYVTLIHIKRKMQSTHINLQISTLKTEPENTIQ